MQSTFKTILDRSETVLSALCVAGFGVMFILGVATVVFRFLLESSLAFPDEVIRYLFVWMIALGSAVALRRGAHASIGVFVQMLPGGARRAALLLAALSSMAFFAVLVVYGVELTVRVAAQISPALEISMSWVYAAVPIGGAFLLVYMSEILITLLTAPDAALLSGEGEA
ncbi:MAG: TRAP transporter small permease [Paracoccaceae bacterium]